MALRFLVRTLVALTLAASFVWGPLETGGHDSRPVSAECRTAQRLARELNRMAREQERRPGSLGSSRITFSCPSRP